MAYLFTIVDELNDILNDKFYHQYIYETKLDAYLFMWLKSHRLDVLFTNIVN